MAKNITSSSHYILMGDVIDSANYVKIDLAEKLNELVLITNKKFKKHTISPYTITLGDEFQGITSSLKSGIELLFFFEEEIMRRSYDFKLHYVLVFGEIETKINSKIAHKMMGEGLTRARKLLTNKKRTRKRFKFDLDSEYISLQLTRLFEVYDGITSKWNVDDYPLIIDMIENESDKEVGDNHGKDRSQIWRRRNNLLVSEYNLLKASIRDLGAGP